MGRTLTRFSRVAIFAIIIFLASSASSSWGIDDSHSSGKCSEPMKEGGTVPKCGGSCTATWDGSHWMVNQKCEGEGCRCDIPETTFATAPGSQNLFGCATSRENATAERFYLTLCGEGTGMHKLQFDKSDADMFKGYFVKLRQGEKVAWRIEARWQPSAYVPVPQHNRQT